MDKQKIVKLTLPNEISYFPIAQALVREAAGKCGFEGASLGQIDIAVEEAVTNVMKHSYDAEENSTFEIVCEPIPEGIQIIIKDMGIPFDPSRIPHYKSSKILEDLSTAGLGVHLMKAMMDEVTFHNLGPEGRETRLVKHLRGKPGPGPGAQAAVPEAEPAVLKEKINYTVRRMEENEAIEVSRCAYKSHGYSFFDDHIYYPERLVELNRTGEMVSAVAVTEDQKFMGHACLLFQDARDLIAELTFVFINVEYRGQGAFNKLVEYLFSAPKKRKLSAIYGYAVSNHVFTQKASVRYGIKDCGILLATSPASWKFKGISGDPTQRISVILSIKYMEPPGKQTLFAPMHHKDMIERLFKNIGADHTFLLPNGSQAELPAGPSAIETSVNKSEGCAEIYLSRCGAQAAQEVRKLLRRFCLDQIASINLFLNMQDPAAALLTKEFEKLGFFFAGILPCSRIGEALILQYLNNVDLDYSKITAYSEAAQEILAYIRERDPNAGV